MLIIQFLLLLIHPGPSKVVCGADQTGRYLPLLNSKRVALVVNPSSLIDGRTHLTDSLLSRNVLIRKIFAPEHGFRGTADAGESLTDTRDAKTGINVISLYGKHLMPSPADLADIDVVVFDLQDVGARFFTYLSTLHYVMKACALNHKDLIVLDRPNPNGFLLDGPVLDTLTSRSFVGMHPVPLAYGMTIGEYARMINGEAWLGKGLTTKLTVISLKGYTHQTRYDLPVAPSPNLPNAAAVDLYPSLCLFEGTVFSIGRGTAFPFQVYGHPLLPKNGFSFEPQSIAGKSKHPPLEGVMCNGVDLRNIESAHATRHTNTICLAYLLNAYASFPDKAKFFNHFFQNLAGTPLLRKQIEQGLSASQIRESWKEPLAKFRLKRQKYLLYP